MNVMTNERGQSTNEKINRLCFLDIDRKLSMIDPAIPCHDFKQLEHRNPETHQTLMKTFDICGKMYESGLMPILLGGFACALVSGSFYREHRDIDIALEYTHDGELENLITKISDLLTSFGYKVNPAKTFDNFFQFFLTDSEGNLFELDVFIIKATQSQNHYEFTPTANTPFTSFKVGKKTLAYHRFDGFPQLITPTLKEICQIKFFDKRSEYKPDQAILMKALIESTKIPFETLLNSPSQKTQTR